MKYNNIIFFVETPILTRYYKRYGIKELRDMGFNVTIFDLSPVLLPVAYKNITSDLCDYDKLGFKLFKNFKYIKKALKDCSPQNTLIICSMGYRFEYRKLFSLLKKYKLHYCYFMQELSVTDGEKIKRSIIQKFSPGSLKRFITRRIPKSIQNVQFADFILGCGYDKEIIKIYKSSRLCKKDCPIYFFHSSNYEECLINKGKKPLMPNDYCVFIDQYLPYHPDNLDAGIKLDAGKYYNELNKFFDFIEKTYGIQVVIAAHPRSNYKLHPECFPHRKIFKNETCMLVKDCRFVIYHFSNSLSYATLFKKPILIVTNKEINNIFCKSINKICHNLNNKPIDISEYSKEEIDKRLKIDNKAYINYVQRFMKKDYDGNLDGNFLWIEIGKFLLTIT